MHLNSGDLEQVEKLLLDGLHSSLAVPNELSQRLVGAGGKRIRPLLMCLTYRSLNNHIKYPPRASQEDLFSLAAVAEWVHTATLFHDDVLDASPTRRDAPSAHVTHGNKVSILVGDFVYAEAFRLLMERGLLEPSKNLAATIKNVVEGELIQHEMVITRSLDLSMYQKIAQAKTASLFAWCTESGAWVAGVDNFHTAKEFGLMLGDAFQMADDLFDTYELNPLLSSDLDLIQWAQSAPPLPLVLAAKDVSSVAHDWKNLHFQTDRKILETKIIQLQHDCRKAKYVMQSLEMIEERLARATRCLEALGNTENLEWAVQAIWKRACEGARLSKNPFQNENLEAKFL